MAKVKEVGLVIFPAFIASFLLWLNHHAVEESWNDYPSYFGIIIVVAVPLFALLFVKLYKKYEMRITEKSFKILFIISALLFLLLSFDDFELWFHNHVFLLLGSNVIYFLFIVAIIISAIPFVAKLFVKLHKKHIGDINESTLFIICMIPFIWGVIDWITNWGAYTLFRYYENDPNAYGISPIGMSLVGNFNLVRGMIITYIAMAVVAALKKDNVKCYQLLPKLFVLAGIYSVTCNVEHVIQNTSFVDFDEFYFVMGMLGSLVPLLFALGCVMITLFVAFLHGFFSKKM